MITGADVTLSTCVIDGMGPHITFQAATIGAKERFCLQRQLSTVERLVQTYNTVRRKASPPTLVLNQIYDCQLNFEQQSYRVVYWASVSVNSWLGSQG